MEGFFNARLLRGPGLGEAELRAAAERGELEDLLRSLPVKREVSGANMVFDNFAAYLFFACMSGGDVTNPYDYGGASNSAFGTAALLNQERAPYYQEASHQNVAPGSLSGIVTSDAWKRFINDDYDPELIQVASDGREAVEFRSRFIFAAGEAISDEIRAFAVHFCEAATSTGANDRGIICKMRLSDGGNPETFQKTIDDVLALEYWFRLVTI